MSPIPIKKLAPEEFPQSFSEMADPPDELYLQGKLPGDGEIFLTVVGSRKFSGYGRDVCEKIISEMTGYPIVIVSGLALGIDALAHQLALRSGLKTVAIPGSGLERSVLHPHSNRPLADKILAAGGALLSEFPPTMPAGLHTFPKRNRLMAALSKATLVVEASERSGTLITARLALDYNRDVLAVPGSIFSPVSAGTNRLIKQGATPVTAGEDILQTLGFNLPIATRPPVSLADLSPKEKRVADMLTTESRSRDDLIRAIGLPVNEVNTLLAMMEIKGLIKESLGEIRLNR